MRDKPNAKRDGTYAQKPRGSILRIPYPPTRAWLLHTAPSLDREEGLGCVQTSSRCDISKMRINAGFGTQRESQELQLFLMSSQRRCGLTMIACSKEKIRYTASSLWQLLQIVMHKRLDLDWIWMTIWMTGTQQAKLSSLKNLPGLAPCLTRSNRGQIRSTKSSILQRFAQSLVRLHASGPGYHVNRQCDTFGLRWP